MPDSQVLAATLSIAPRPHPREVNPTASAVLGRGPDRPQAADEGALDARQQQQDQGGQRDQGHGQHEPWRHLPDEREQQQGRDHQVADQQDGEIGGAVVGAVGRQVIAAGGAGRSDLQIAVVELAGPAVGAAVQQAALEAGGERPVFGGGSGIGHGAHMAFRAGARKALGGEGYFASLAVSSTALPTAFTSLPTPSTVLQALTSRAAVAAARMTILRMRRSPDLVTTAGECLDGGSPRLGLDFWRRRRGRSMPRKTQWERDSRDR